jgi:hypothetical protein
VFNAGRQISALDVEDDGCRDCGVGDVGVTLGAATAAADAGVGSGPVGTDVASGPVACTGEGLLATAIGSEVGAGAASSPSPPPHATTAIPSKVANATRIVPVGPAIFESLPSDISMFVQ